MLEFFKPSVDRVQARLDDRPTDQLESSAGAASRAATPQRRRDLHEIGPEHAAKARSSAAVGSRSLREDAMQVFAAQAGSGGERAAVETALSEARVEPVGVEEQSHAAPTLSRRRTCKVGAAWTTLTLPQFDRWLDFLIVVGAGYVVHVRETDKARAAGP